MTEERRPDWEAEQRISEIAAGLPLPETPDLNLQLSAINRKIAEAESVVARRGFFTMPRLGFAMAAVLIGALLIFWRQGQPLIFETQPGQVLTKTLADGSSVDLRAGSHLVLLPGFNKGHRNLELEGEAFFHVEKSDQPFRIQAGGTLITVLGTQFNVVARDKVVVGVSEGRVRFSTQAGEEVVLTAGMEASFSAQLGLTEPATIPVDNFPAWKQGVFVFQNEPLALVCAELERHFAIHIQLDATLSQKRVTGRLRGTTPEELVGPLSALVSAQWRQEGKSLIIEP